MKIKTETIIRTIVLTLALANQILTSTGHTVIPVSDDQIAELITLVATIGASLWSWWKNNSFTAEAIKADKYLKDLKSIERGVNHE
jgi:SPP1 family holin|nr:MAG TPA: holin [Caudoviricetes sp.]